MTIADELRAECARILARHYGGIPDAIAAIRVSTVARIDAYVTEAEDRAAACTCETPAAYAIPTRRDKPVHAMFIARRLERMRVEEAGL
jgi:hypothetical protein